MLRRSLIANVTLCAVTSLTLAPQTAQAGPLIDWLFGRKAPPAYPVGQPVPVGQAGVAAGYAPYTAGYAPAYAGGYVPAYAGGNTAAYPGTYSANYPGTYSTAYPGSYTANYGAGNYAAGTYLPGNNTAAPTGISSGATSLGPQFSGPGYNNAAPFLVQQPPPPSSVSYVPNFRTNYYRAPVTYYRPVQTTDPTTGQQITVQVPCSSYEYQTQRRPALGQSALFGATQPPVYSAAPVAPQSFTLPSGGVPLAYSQSTLPSTSRSFGGYTTLQPGQAVPAAAQYGNYQTAPLGATPYYGAPPTAGCGGYTGQPGQVPGLYAAPAPQQALPAAPSSPSTLPPSTFPSQAPPATGPATVLPPTTQDPADFRPTLPSGFPTTSGNSTSGGLRSQLRSITQHPVSPDWAPSTTPADTAGSSASQDDEPARLTVEPPALRPIPVPDDFDSQTPWAPGLLREQDMTASRNVPDGNLVAARAAQVAGQSKRIHWASFNTSRASSSERELGLELELELPRQTLRPSVTQQPAVIEQPKPSAGMVPIAPPSFAPAAVGQPQKPAFIQQPGATSPAGRGQTSSDMRPILPPQAYPASSSAAPQGKSRWQPTGR